MATWTGTVNRIQKDAGRTIVNVTISSAAGSFTRDFVADFIAGAGAPADFVAWLKQQAINWAGQIDAVYAFADSLTPGASVDFTPPVVTPPDPAFVAFQNQVILMRRLHLAVVAGVISASNATYTSTQASILASVTANPGWVTAFDMLH